MTTIHRFSEPTLLGYEPDTATVIQLSDTHWVATWTFVINNGVVEARSLKLEPVDPTNTPGSGITTNLLRSLSPRTASQALLPILSAWVDLKDAAS